MNCSKSSVSSRDEVGTALSAEARCCSFALDFMTETLYDRRRIRLLTVIDEGNREGLEIAMGVSFPSRRVTRVLSELVALHGCPWRCCAVRKLTRNVPYPQTR